MKFSVSNNASSYSHAFLVVGVYLMPTMSPLEENSGTFRVSVVNIVHLLEARLTQVAYDN